MLCGIWIFHIKQEKEEEEEEKEEEEEEEDKQLCSKVQL